MGSEHNYGVRALFPVSVSENNIDICSGGDNDADIFREQV